MPTLPHLVNNYHKRSHRFDDFGINGILSVKDQMLTSCSVNGSEEQNNSGRREFFVDLEILPQ